MTAIQLLDTFATPWIAALVNSIWQSLLVALAVAGVLHCAKGLSASTRYAVWWAALAATLAIIGADFGSAPSRDHHVMAPPAAVAEGPSRPEPHLNVNVAPAVIPVAMEQAPTPALPAPFKIRTPLEIQARWLPGMLAGVWMVGVLAMLARAFGGIWMLIRIKTRAVSAPEVYRSRVASLGRACGVRRRVRVGTSAGLRTPVAAGLYGPAVLFPSTLLPELTDEEFDQITLHELAHIRRWDDWANLIQRVIESLFVFHPVVRFISRRLDLEREVACDDLVVERTGEPRNYAECLTRLVEMTGWARQWAAAPGAMLHKSHVTQRVEKLLDRTRNVDPKVTKRVVFSLCFALAGMVLLISRAPVLWAFAPPPPELMAKASPEPTGQSYSGVMLGDDGIHMHTRWTEGSRTFAVDTEGRIEFSDDDHDVKSLSPDGHFRMDEQGSPDRRYEVKADGSGRISRTYFENGKPTEMNDAGRRWLAERMPQLIRESGIDAEKRVQRILKQQGPNGVTAEIRLIHSDGSKRRYLQEFMLHGGLNGTQLRAVMRLADGISSDGDKSALLTSVAPQYLKDDLRRDLFDVIDAISSDGDHARVIASVIEDDPTNRETLLLSARSAGRIPSDGEKARLLVSLAAHYLGNDVNTEMRGAWFATLNSVSSDGEKRRALSAIITSDGKDRETLAETMKSAARISSDGERAALLVESSDYYVEDPVVRRNFFAAVDGISSAGEKHRVLSSLYEHSNRNPATVKQILRSAKEITSDGEKAALLAEVAGQNQLEADLLDDFFAACDSISSDGERSRVLLRAVERSNGTPPVLLRALASTDRISSDGEKARVLAEVIQLNPRDGGVRSALRRSIEGVHSDGEYRKLSVAFSSQGTG